MKTIITLLAITAFFLPYYAIAEDECVDQHTGFNICSEARNLSEGLARQLPMQLSQRMTWDSVASYGNTLQAHILFTYDRAYLDAISEAFGMPTSQMKEGVKNFAKGMCAEDAIEAFVFLGGRVRLVYRFSDGEKFTDVVVDDC